MSTAAAPRTEEQWMQLTREKLRPMMTNRGLETTGTKKDWVERLMAYDAEQQQQQQQKQNSASYAAVVSSSSAAALSSSSAAAAPSAAALLSTAAPPLATAAAPASSSSAPAVPSSSSAAAAQPPFVPPLQPAPGTTFTVSSADLEGITVPDEIKALLDSHGKSVELLDRNNSSDLFQRLLTSDEAPRPHYLTGVGGVGKSSILLMMVVLAMRHNRAFFERLAAPAPAPAPAPVNAPAATPFDGAIFLIYLPKTDAFIQQPPEVAASQLIGDLRIANRRLLSSGFLDEPAFRKLKDAFVRQKNSSGHFESALNQWGRINAALVGLESQSHRFRVLVLIDQWNSIIHHKALPVGHEDKLKADHPAQAFYKLDAAFGFSLFVAAVSSSFNMSADNALKGAQISKSSVPIAPLTSTEAETLRAIWYYRNPPTNQPRLEVTAEQMQRLFLKVGGVARILQFYADSRYEKDSDTNFATLCMDYYDRRLKRLIELYRPLESFKDLVQDLTTIFVHGRLSVRFADVWLQTGMVKRDSGDLTQLIPVSDLVRRAGITVFRAERGGFLHLIYAVATIRWHAIEAFFLLHLRDSTMLSGVSRSGARLSLTTTVSDVHVLDRSVGAGNVKTYLQTHNNGKPFPANTLFIPGWSNHPVADAVLLTTRLNTTPALVFFQVSQQSYSNHASKIPELATSPLSNGTSVIDTYRELYGIHCDSAYQTPGIAQGQLPECVKYVFATSDTSISTSHSVFFMQASHLREMDPAGWENMTRSSP
ncbi:hypothetical protein CAOG_09157 [Capsaspora owczarzaki ATCC 30864]|uniref:SAP domain-containing protein n=1 Tax=Capsaspora owczarzaki (strain ATCC 30864) TaxID=595528 RepID=A0A0D2WXN1_CAPO3|nr:hypothetical protein CAOG_09157 [Capsaspora owczarzaki ATCC 30864]KJE98005.1 hypothetical protein CAOG_009157 [Capsaspora owczarzaki ATCC 30864]|eukprot:XP_011270870.1 hypothetical protein CAOG_09157 [Capsaspora owczarzaki ATCC 30864]